MDCSKLAGQQQAVPRETNRVEIAGDVNLEGTTGNADNPRVQFVSDTED